jgi:hypothetical protein
VGVLWLSLGSEKRHSAKVSRRLAETMAAFDYFKAEVQAKTALAKAQDAAHAARVERDQATIAERTNDEIRNRIAAARAVAGRVRGESCKADPGGGRIETVPSPSNAAGSADRARAAAELADLAICAENTEKAAGWLDWWKAVQAVPR